MNFCSAAFISRERLGGEKVFGYISANLAALDKEQQTRYRAYYCGLCRVLREKYGQQGRTTLSNDMTFLAILLSSLYEPRMRETSGVCPLHPLAARRYTDTDVFPYAADMNLLLAYYMCLDGVRDDHSRLKDLRARALKPHFEAITLRYPQKCAAIQNALERITILESQRSEQLDELCSLSGRIVGEVFRYRDDEWSRMLYDLGSSLGRFIYMMDAYEDYDADRRLRRFNPLVTLHQSPDYEDQIKDILFLLAGQAAEQLDLLPLERDLDLIRNVIYSGLWARYARMHKKDQTVEDNSHDQ